MGFCDDNDADIHPGAEEVCDLVDNDCDDQTDEDGFTVVQAAGGLAVFIGPPRQNTKALYQLESPAEVQQTLELLTCLDQA